MAKNYPKEAVVEKALVTHADLDGDEGGNLVTDLLSGRKKMLEQIVLYENMFSTYMSGAIFLTDIEAKGIRNSFSPGDNLTIAVRKFKRANADVRKNIFYLQGRINCSDRNYKHTILCVAFCFSFVCGIKSNCIRSCFF